MKLTNPQHAALVLEQLGMDTYSGTYKLEDGNLTVPGFTDKLIADAEASIPQEKIDAWERKKQLAQAKALRRQQEDVGFQWKGYTIPLHHEDAMAMLQVKTAFEFGAKSTNIEFTNGVVVPVTAAEFPTLAQQFVVARNALFGGP